MVSGGKTTLCDYSVLFSSVIYQEETAGLDFVQKAFRSSGAWDETVATIAYQAIRIVPVDTNGMRWYRGIPIFLSSFLLLPPYNPLLLSIYLSNSPLKQINCLRPPRRNGATTATTTNNNQMFFVMVLSHYNPLSPKARPLASRADRRQGLVWGLNLWMVCDYSRDGELTSFCGRLNMYKCCITVWAVDYKLKATYQQEQFALLAKNIEVFSLRLFPVECYGLNEMS